jgi:hypothetical protein
VSRGYIETLYWTSLTGGLSQEQVQITEASFNAMKAVISAKDSTLLNLSKVPE